MSLIQKPNWFLNQNQKILVGPHIVPGGTANKMPLHKIRKQVQNRPTRRLAVVVASVITWHVHILEYTVL